MTWRFLDRLGDVLARLGDLLSRGQASHRRVNGSSHPQTVIIIGDPHRAPEITVRPTNAPTWRDLAKVWIALSNIGSEQSDEHGRSIYKQMYDRHRVRKDLPAGQIGGVVEVSGQLRSDIDPNYDAFRQFVNEFADHFTGESDPDQDKVDRSGRSDPNRLER